MIRLTGYAPYLNNVPVREIIEELSENGVTLVFKFMKWEVHEVTF